MSKHKDGAAADDDAHDGAPSWRLSFDRRLSLGTVIHVVLLLLGGIWALSEIKAELSTEIATISAQIAAIQKDLDEFKSDMKSDVAELRGELNGKQDRPLMRLPARP
jgi:outer membrane murein-binding lipoprotein Lpp